MLSAVLCQSRVAACTAGTKRHISSLAAVSGQRLTAPICSRFAPFQLCLERRLLLIDSAAVAGLSSTQFFSLRHLAIPSSVLRMPSQGSPLQNPEPSASPSATTSSKGSAAEEEAKEALRQVFYELRLKLRSRQPIGSAFRLLSPENRKTLAKQRLPFEQFLLHFPHHFCTFRSKIASNTGTIQVCPPYQAPPMVRPLVLAPNAHCAMLMEIAGEEVNGTAKPPLSSAPHGAGARGTDQLDDTVSEIPLSKKEQLELILSNIPDDFVSFVDLRVPQRIKEEYMGYPTVKPKEFFLRYPHLFEVRASPDGPHTFYVRRKTKYFS